MDFGMCGGDTGQPCANFAQGLGSFGVFVILMALAFLAIFLGVRLVYLAFHFPKAPLDAYDVRKIVRTYVEDGSPWHNGSFGEGRHQEQANLNWSLLYDKMEAERARRAKAEERPQANDTDTKD